LAEIGHFANYIESLTARGCRVKIHASMSDLDALGHDALPDYLSGLVQAASQPPAVPRESPFKVIASPNADRDLSAGLRVVVTMNEVNERHGTGPLVQRICAGWPAVFSIRAQNDWDGSQEFGDWNVCLPRSEQLRWKSFADVLTVLQGRQVRTVLCVPFLSNDLLTAIAVAESFNAKLCIYLMDDQNVAGGHIPDGLMKEALDKASLRLVTHPELRFVYERKYRLPFYLLPAIVPASLVAARPLPSQTSSGRRRRGALIGSFWDQRWFDSLCEVLRDCDCDIDWFGNNKSPWVRFPADSLAQAGITARGLVPEAQLAAELATYPFVIVPTGALDGSEKTPGVALLSLPGRILFALATSHTPLLLVGSSRTCGSRFVTHFEIGEVVPYEATRVSAAMDRLSEPGTQLRMRQNAAAMAPALSDAGLPAWLEASIQLERPADSRFEDLFAGYDAEIDLGSPIACAS
jgi:hypothetical protein